jgi:GAF domain-containing protein
LSLNGGDPDLIVLSALAHAVASTGPPDVLYSAIAKNAVTALDAKVAHVWINDATALKLVAAGSFGVPAETELALLSDVSLRHGTGIPGHIVVNGVAEFIEDAHDDPRWVNVRYIREMNLHAYAGVPLVTDGLVVGVLSVLFTAPRAFTEKERLLAGALADYAAITVRIAQLSNEQRRAAALDAVVRLANAAAHELNNPLAVVIGRLGMLERQLNDRPDAIDQIERMASAADRLRETIQQLTRITRLESFDHNDSHLPPMLDIRRSTTP